MARQEIRNPLKWHDKRNKHLLYRLTSCCYTRPRFRWRAKKGKKLSSSLLCFSRFRRAFWPYLMFCKNKTLLISTTGRCNCPIRAMRLEEKKRRHKCSGKKWRRGSNGQEMGGNSLLRFSVFFAIFLSFVAVLNVPQKQKHDNCKA